ncbi:MAG: DNA polymerase III subunit gamma/tau [Planctomycetes bacterium]|nr:DNA polymerase III subunit gamma/tau [Planctomycetota bacterium]
MSYTVLARKYRSQNFDDIVGQDPIAQTLKNAIQSDRVAHAYLFSGTRGIGKTTMARVLAKALNCLNADAPTIEPCCKCESCLAVNAGEDIDVIEIDGASNNGVEEVRKLRENAIYRPARARFKIYVIDEVHMLSNSAFNALLKILEEPPEHVKFIFATTEPNKVIATIQSRCQRFDFNNISPANIAKQLKFVLKKEKIKFQEDLLLPLAKMANGSMRDALSLLDRLISIGTVPLTPQLLEQFLGCTNSEKIYNLIEKIGDSDAAQTLAVVEELINTGQSEPQIVDSLVDCMRDLMVTKSAGRDTELLILTDEQRKRLGQLTEKFDIAALIYNITTLEKLRWTIKNSDAPRALLEASLLRFALSQHFLNVDTLLAQMQSGQSAPLKKNKIVNNTPAVSPNTTKTEEKTDVQSEAAQFGDMQAIKDNWKSILKVISSKFGNGTSALLNSAAPARLENNILTLSFPASARPAMQMCESTGRAEQIQTILNENYETNVKVQFEVEVGSQPKTEILDANTKTASQKKNQIVNDPAVRKVLLGLEATIIDIEQNK